MLSKFLDPKNDIAFKKIFGNEKNKDILIHFLNDMLKFKERKPITEVTFLNTVQDPLIAARKTSVVDIMCKDELGNSYIVEMQITKERGFIKRSQYYAAKAYCSQLGVKGKYKDLKEIIFLAIADFTMFPNKANYKSDHITLDKNSHENDLKDFSYTFLELEKFNVPIGQLKTMTEKWAYFFKHAEETNQEDLNNIIGSDLIIKKAYEELDHFYWNEKELQDYEAANKKAMDYEAAMDQKYDEGKTEGKNEGKAEEKIETAKKMLNENMDLALIAKLTGLTVEKVTELKLET
jgi:predicted transposase/invertase (TIGR01784 family)